METVGLLFLLSITFFDYCNANHFGPQSNKPLLGQQPLEKKQAAADVPPLSLCVCGSCV